MVWGAVAAVPTVGWLGGGLLVGLLAGAGLRSIRRRSTGLVLLLALAYAPVAEAQMTEASCALVGGAWDAGTSTCSSIPVSLPHTFADGAVADAAAMNENFEAFSVSVPHTFTNGTVANADEVNANFQALKAGVDTCSNNLVFLFAQGDQQACANVGGTWDAVASSCTAPPCDDTGNDAAILESVCIQSGGSSYNAGNNTCVGLTAVANVWAALEAGVSQGCAAGGGTWDSSASSCTAATPASTACEESGGTWDAATGTCTPYSCYLGAFCSKLHIDYPVQSRTSFPNIYAGHTRGSGDALKAGCNDLPRSDAWTGGLVGPTRVVFDFPTAIESGLALCGSECSIDSDCVADEWCYLVSEGKGICTEPLFTSCLIDSDCAAGEVCLLFSGGESGLCSPP